MDLVKLFTDTDPRGVFLVNLILCLVGLLWTLGIQPAKRDVFAWRGWMGFWIGTAIYYLVQAVRPSLPFWIPSLGLYLATDMLLVWFYISPGRYTKTIVGCSVLVVVAAIVDVVTATPTNNGSAHQAMTAMALGLWAWRLRLRDESKSVAMLTYALVQLPIQPILVWLNMGNSDGYKSFESATFVLYAALKLTIVPATLLLATQAGEGSSSQLVLEQSKD